MCLFCTPFTTAQIRYFDEYEVGEAQAWIPAESDTEETQTALPKQSLFENQL